MPAPNPRRELLLVDLKFRLVLFLLLAIGLGASARLRRRADRLRGAVPRSADRPWIAAALRLAGFAFYGSLLAWLIHPPVLEWARVEIGTAVRWAGAPLTAAGVGLALWSLRHLGDNVTPTAVARSDAALVVSGPYSRVRHPLYSSMLLTVPGCGLLTGNAVVLGGGAAVFAVVLVRTRHEEALLYEKFGARYVCYARKTGRVLPRLRSSSSDCG